MSALDYLFNGTPQSVTNNISSTSDMPDWYQEYIRGIAGKGTQIAGQGYQPYEGQRIADFNDTQRQAFDQVGANQGNWKPNVDAATAAAGTIQPTAQAGLNQAGQYGAGAVQAASGAPQQWTQNWQQYMSPYTQSVTDEIARLGNRNFSENIMPAVGSSFVGSGQFGSTRNAEIMGRAARDTQADITGQQSQALQAGYGTANNAFNADATRAQQGQQLAANTGIQAGQLATTGAQVGSAAADTAAQRLGALGQLGQTLGSNDAAALGAVGGQQQQQEQTGYDTAYNEFNNQKNYDWTNLNNLSSLVRGQQLPTGQTTTGTQTNNAGTSSPLGWVNALYGLNRAGTTASQ